MLGAIALFGLGATIYVAAQTGQNPNASAEPCNETGPHYGGWSCTTGSVKDPGALSKTNAVICVGASASSSVSGTTFNDGSKTRTITYDCSSPTTETVLITYSATNWFEPPIPPNFPTCGTFTFTAKVKGVTSDTDCPSETATVTVGTFTVKVEAVTDLQPTEGTLVAGSSPPEYKVCAGAGDVIVTASDCLGLAEADLPGCWSFTGGTAVGLGKLQRKISKSTTSATNVFTCTAGTSSKTIKIIFGCPCSTPLSDAEWNIIKAGFPRMIRCHTCKEADATWLPTPRPPYPFTSVAYNCLAWTIGDTTRWWDVEADGFGNGDGRWSAAELNAFYTAKGVPAGSIAYFGTGLDNVAHVAKKSGGPADDCKASSKPGQGTRISHDLHEMEGGTYQNIVGGN